MLGGGGGARDGKRGQQGTGSDAESAVEIRSMLNAVSGKLPELSGDPSDQGTRLITGHDAMSPPSIIIARR